MGATKKDTEVVNLTMEIVIELKEEKDPCGLSQNFVIEALLIMLIGYESYIQV